MHIRNPFFVKHTDPKSHFYFCFISFWNLCGVTEMFNHSLTKLQSYVLEIYDVKQLLVNSY